MPYLVDGHNLIGTWPGGRVGDRARETELRHLLRRFARARRTGVTVVFDGAAPDDLPRDDARLGPLRVVYAGTGPDAADRRILSLLAATPRPREWTVVTSDRALGQAVRTRGGGWLSCARFRGELERALEEAQGGPEDPPPPGPAEVEEWLRLFGEGEPDER